MPLTSGNQRRIRGSCPVCSKVITTKPNGIIQNQHKEEDSNIYCNSVGRQIIQLVNIEPINGVPVTANQVPVPASSQETAVESVGNDENINLNININPDNEVIVPPIEPIVDIDNATTYRYPNIFYSRFDKPKVMLWANNMAAYLNQLEASYRSGNEDDINRMFETVFKYQHPKAKSERVEPNVTEHDEDPDQSDEHGFRPDEAYSILRSD